MRQFIGKLITIRRAIVVVIIIILLILVAIVKINRPNLAKSNQASLQTDGRTTVQPAKKTISINKNFTFNITDSKNQSLGKIDYLLDTAELRNQIIIKGETATAVKGKIFLIINLKLKNDLKTPLTLNTRNYIRLSVNDNANEWLAPDIHNDPVEIQPISTKLGRVGFVISDTDQNLTLQLGEINNDKTTINLKFDT